MSSLEREKKRKSNDSLNKGFNSDQWETTLKIPKLKVVRFAAEDAGCEHLFVRADGDIKNQTYVGVLAKL